MPTADAHVHLFPDGYAGTRGPLLQNELEIYEQLRQAFAIDRALVVGYQGEPRYRDNNAYILELARMRPWIAPLAYLDERQPEVEQLRQLHTAGAIGYAIYVREAREARAISTWPLEVLAELNRQRSIISLNATPAATAELVPFIDALEEATVLFSHLGLPGRFPTTPTPSEAAARLQPLVALSDRPHVHVKFSGLYAISEPAHDFPHAAAQPLLDVLLEAFGAARLCWGSDFAPALEFVSFGQVADDRLLAALGPEDLAAVMGGNLQRLLPPSRDKE